MNMAEPQVHTSATKVATNRILAGLDPEELQALMPHLQRVDLTTRQPLWEPNQPLEAVYFPVTSVNSIMALDEQGGEIEVGTVGNEGVVGLPVFLGATSSPGRAFTQIAGTADRVGVVEFRRAARHERLRSLLNLYTQAFVSQVSQSVACNRLHNPERRLARWLLMCRDRVGRHEYPLTQHFMAQMLGVRRATVGEAAGSLQDRGLIRYRRGTLTITDPAGLESASCECYRIVRDEFERLLGAPIG
jgi:CRP-like cAMP-binding protein